VGGSLFCIMTFYITCCSFFEEKNSIIKVVNFLPRLQEVLKSKPLVIFLDKKNPCLYYHAIYQMFTYFASFTGYEDDTKVVSSLAKMRKLSFNQNLLQCHTQTQIRI
jgi:hypothetical protein